MKFSVFCGKKTSENNWQSIELVSLRKSVVNRSNNLLFLKTTEMHKTSPKRRIRHLISAKFSVPCGKKTSKIVGKAIELVELRD